MVGCQSMPLDYAGLNDKIANGDQVAVGELRRAFLDLEDLPERMERLRDLELQAAQLFEDEPLKLGSIGTAILDTYYGSLTGHFALSRFYEFVGSEEAAVPHRQWQARIREDMEASADGSRESPYPAVTDVEAQMYAVSLGLSPVGSIYQTGEAFPYTLLIQARPADGPLRNLYFDLGGWYESMRRQFPDENEFSPFALIGFQARRGDTAAQVAVGAFLATQGRGVPETFSPTPFSPESSGRRRTRTAKTMPGRPRWTRCWKTTCTPSRSARPTPCTRWAFST